MAAPGTRRRMTMKGDPSDDDKEPIGRLSLTRRDLFEFAGLVIATAAFPLETSLRAASPLGASSQQKASPIMETLSAYMSDARRRARPDGVAEKAKQPILEPLAA